MNISKEKYPTDKDIKNHTEQFVKGIRSYFINGSDINFVKNDLRCLFTDLLLEYFNNHSGDDYLPKGESNFDRFLKALNGELKERK